MKPESGTGTFQTMLVAYPDIKDCPGYNELWIPVQVGSAVGCFLTGGTGAVSSSCNTPGWSTPCYRRSRTSPEEDQPGLQAENTHT